MKTDKIIQIVSVFAILSLVISLFVLFPDQLIFTFFAFLPTIFHFVISMNMKNKFYLFLNPIILTGLYFYIHNTGIFYVISGADAKTVVVLNLILSFLFSIILILIDYFPKVLIKKEKVFVSKDSSKTISVYQERINFLQELYEKLRWKLEGTEQKLVDSELDKRDLAFYKDELKQTKFDLISKQNEFNRKSSTLLNQLQKSNEKIPLLEKELEHFKSQLKITQNKNSILANQENQNEIKKRYERIINELAKEVDFHKKRAINSSNFKKNIQSIEDKAKALNFAIGRVFSKNKGATKSFRETLRIKKELYNEFSKISNNQDAKNYLLTIRIVKKIVEKLMDFRLPLVDYNSIQSQTNQINLEKYCGKNQVNSSDSIIAILAQLDSDPVANYYEELIGICIGLINHIKTQLNK